MNRPNRHNRVLAQSLSNGDDFDLHENQPRNTFSFGWFLTKTGFDTEAIDNSEKAIKRLVSSVSR